MRGHLAHAVPSLFADFAFHLIMTNYWMEFLLLVDVFLRLKLAFLDEFGEQASTSIDILHNTAPLRAIVVQSVLSQTCIL